MSSPYVGEMRWFSFPFAPKGWALVNGQILPISQNQALFSLLGTTYGGNGINNFALPNMQGSVPIHTSTAFTQGQTGGEESHTLSVAEMTIHSHGANAVSSAGTSPTPAVAFWAGSATGDLMYSSSSTGSAMISGTVGNAGGSQPHTNQQPYLVLNLCMALFGIFPTRN
jgi:microcystin-dependent protein